MEYTFETPEPVDLYLELDRGQVTVTAVATGQSSLRVEGDQPERLQVHADGNRIRAVVERRSLFDFAPSLRVWVTVPVESRAAVRTGSAGVAAAGRLAEATVTSGSGDVEVAEAGTANLQTGSGQVRVGTVGQLRAKTGSGDVTVGEVAGPALLHSGSGNLRLGHARANASLKTASGDIAVEVADADLVTTTASGDIAVSRVSRGDITGSSASGSLRIGVPPAVPVWTDISTLTGRISSDLAGAGRPQAGQDHLRLRAKTVSGDVRLEQLQNPDVLR